MCANADVDVGANMEVEACGMGGCDGVTHFFIFDYYTYTEKS